MMIAKLKIASSQSSSRNHLLLWRAGTSADHNGGYKVQ
jgi:hypothetical protein